MIAPLEPGWYRCLTCDRDVDADEEPSPGEPTRCGDCFWHSEKEAS